MRVSVGRDTGEAKATMIRKRYLLLLIIILAGACFIFVANSVTKIDILFNRPVSLLQSHRHKINHNVRATIHTEGCTIPALDPMDESIKRFVEYPENLPKCPNATFALLGKYRTTIWIRGDEDVLDFYNITDEDVVSCCCRSFYRPVSVEDITSKYVDNRFKYEDCVTFNNSIEVEHEFVRVNCSVGSRQIYEQFYLFAPMKNFTKHGEKDEIVNNTGYNVLIVGIDSVSRLNFLRTMPKTESYLKTKGAIDMLGYNKVGFNTFPNLVPMLMGVKTTELKKLCHPYPTDTFDNCPFVWKLYNQAGYYTAFAEDGTSYSTFNYIKSGFSIAPTDYYIRTFLHEAEKHVSTGSNMCMNDIYYYKVLLDYMEDITRCLKFRRMFGLFWETTLSHDDLNYPMRMDDDYVKMFRNLEASGYLADTIVFFVSDHGIRWGPIRGTKQGRLEESLPFLYLLTPPSFQKRYKKAFSNLKLNSERLTTPFDVYETLSDLLDLTNVDDSAISARGSQSYASNRGISLFLSIPSNRTCRTADIDDHWCTCRKEVYIAKDHPKVVEAAQMLVKAINFRLMNYPQCAILYLTEVLDAIEIQVGGVVKKDEVSWTEYMVVVQTAPSDALFEAVLRLSSKDQSWRLINAPSRLNKYGDQSRCIEDYKLRNYCYCD